MKTKRELKVTVHIQLRKEIADKLQKLAEHDNRPMSTMAALIIQRTLESKEGIAA